MCSLLAGSDLNLLKQTDMFSTTTGCVFPHSPVGSMTRRSWKIITTQSSPSERLVCVSSVKSRWGLICQAVYKTLLNWSWCYVLTATFSCLDLCLKSAGWPETEKCLQQDVMCTSWFQTDSSQSQSSCLDPGLFWVFCYYFNAVCSPASCPQGQQLIWSVASSW